MLSPTISFWFLVGYRPLWGTLVLHAARFIDVVDVFVLCQSRNIPFFLTFEPLTHEYHHKLEIRLSTITSSNERITTELFLEFT
jgi:hypothetical protein